MSDATKIGQKLGLLPAQRPVVRPMFRALAIAAGGMSAQRVRMETSASNIANAETTRGPDGQPYRRRVVTMQASPLPAAYDPSVPGQLPWKQDPFGVRAFEVPALDRGGVQVPLLPMDNPSTVSVSSVTEDLTEGQLVYNPGHPDANGQGYVRMPNVSITDEVVDLMDARRIYEANATVFQSAKAILKRSLEI